MNNSVITSIVGLEDRIFNQVYDQVWNPIQCKSFQHNKDNHALYQKMQISILEVIKNITQPIRVAIESQIKQ